MSALTAVAAWTGPIGSDTAALIRVAPKQDRSALTHGNILDSAAAAIADFGSLRLTTTIVAEYSECGVGTIYRYFPDRGAIVQALCTRNVDLFLLQCLADIPHRRHVTWTDSFAAVLQQLQHFFSREPGFASVRFGDRFGYGWEADRPKGIGLVAREISSHLLAAFPGLDKRRLASVVEESLILGEAVLSRAFRETTVGNPALLFEAQSIACSHLERRYGLFEHGS